MKCVYIYNPKSGKRKQVKYKDYIIKKLLSKFDVVDVRETKKQGDASIFAGEACGVYDMIVVAGGDGTMNEVINGLAEKENRPKIGYIPTGTVNDLAHSLGIPKNIKKALNIILKGNSFRHDIFKVDGKYGIYVCAFGIFTATSYATDQKSKNKFGKLAYYFTGVKEIKRTKKFPVTVKSENLQFTTDAILCVIANSRYVGGFKIDNEANCHDGYVNLIIFKEKNPRHVSLKTLLTICKLFLGGLAKLRKVKNCHIVKLDKFSVELADNIPVNLDGEIGHKGSFDFEILNEHIDICVK